VLHTKVLPGNPYDGHTLSGVIDATEKLTGCAIERAYVDKGYRGHDTANPHRVFISGQRRGISGLIKRELRRRSAIEAVIGHMTNDGHLGRCYLNGRRCGQRYPHRRRPQLPPAPRLAQRSLAANPDRHPAQHPDPISPQFGLLTTDSLLCMGSLSSKFRPGPPSGRFEGGHRPLAG
jgi:hypothetical protein